MLTSNARKSLPLEGVILALLGVLYGAYVGLGLGFGQWLAVRQHIHRAWRWVLLSSGVWAVSMALGWIVGGMLRTTTHLFISEVIGLMVAWGAIAALSGIGIVGLIHTPVSTSGHTSELNSVS